MSALSVTLSIVAQKDVNRFQQDPNVRVAALSTIEAGTVRYPSRKISKYLYELNYLPYLQYQSLYLNLDDFFNCLQKYERIILCVCHL